MPTLGDLQTRISTEMTRDDLGDELRQQLNQTIVDAINDYADERFSFNEVRVTSTLLAGAQYVNLPSGYQSIDKLYAVVGSVNFEIHLRSMEYIEALYANPQTGQPIEYAIFNGQARIWPTPNVTYPAIWLTVSQVSPQITVASASADGGPAISNNWTNEGQRLICARAKELLYRNVFKDWDAATAAKQDVAEAYAQLRGFSNRNLSTGRIRPSW